MTPAGPGGRRPHRPNQRILSVVQETAFHRLLDAAEARGFAVKRNGERAQIQCGAHNDKSPSVSVRRIEGRVLLFCHAGCATEGVVASYGLTMADLFDDRRGATYVYPDNRRVHRKPNKTWTQAGNTKGHSLYRVDRIGSAETVYVVEGENDCLAIESVGGFAVTSAMGAKKAHLADWTPLRGRHVIVVADRDAPGREHARQVQRLLDGVAASVRIVEAAAGKDAADHIAAGKGLGDFIADAAPNDIDATGGVTLLDELHAALSRYVAFGDYEATAVTLWVAVTHALPAFECAPRLAITSPVKRCGKTRLLDIVAGTCHRALATADATVAAIFRSLGGDHPPTILIDEADAIWGNRKMAEQNEDLRKLLNAGHQRGRPALRCVGPNQIPTQFDVFAMVALAGIGRLPDTITDRAVCISMRRRSGGERVEQFRSRRDAPKLLALRDRLAEWATTRIDALAEAEPDVPAEDRAADTWEPLIAIADAAGGRWPERARKACRALAASADDDAEESLNIRLLADIEKVFDGSFMPSADLLGALMKLDESPWNDFDLTASKLARRLREFGVKPKRDTTGNARGYARETLEDAFERYTRQKASDRQKEQVEGVLASDALTPQSVRSDRSDGLTRQAKTNRQKEPAGSNGFLTGLTPSDGGYAKSVPQAAPDGADDAGRASAPASTNGHADATTNPPSKQTSPLCEACGEPMLAGQTGTHLSCRPTQHPNERKT